MLTKSNGCEMVFLNDTVGKVGTDGAFDSNGDIKYGIVTDAGAELGVVKTAYDNFDAVDKYMMAEQSAYIYIPVHSTFKSVSEVYFGKHGLGMVASNKTGVTLSMDSIHWNDNGHALVAALINPIFDF